MAIAAALATSTCTGPSWASTAATIAGPAPSPETSAGAAMPPIRPATSDSRPSSAISLTAPRYPSAASRSAAACPCPCAAPVTRATLPPPGGAGGSGGVVPPGRYCPSLTSDHRPCIGGEHFAAVHGALGGQVVDRARDLR